MFGPSFRKRRIRSNASINTDLNFKCENAIAIINIYINFKKKNKDLWRRRVSPRTGLSYRLWSVVFYADFNEHFLIYCQLTRFDWTTDHIGVPSTERFTVQKCLFCKQSSYKSLTCFV